MLIFAMVTITLALVFYSVGVWRDIRRVGLKTNSLVERRMSC